MIRHATRAEIEALNNLVLDKDFQTVRDWLGESLEETMSQLVNNTDPAIMHQCQGSAQDLRQLVELADNARQRFREIRESDKKKHG